MSKDLTVRPIFIDTEGATSAITTPILIYSIVVYPMAANWNVVINESSAAAKIIFKAFGTAYETFQFLGSPNLITTLYVTTLTNCELLIFPQ